MPDRIFCVASTRAGGSGLASAYAIYSEHDQAIVSGPEWAVEAERPDAAALTTGL
jgi:hypothetical protein